mgnify:CR=1 FL=1
MSSIEISEEMNMQIRKFLKQVGVSSHQLIEEQLKSNTSTCNICIKIEINKKKIKKFETILN